MKTIILIVLTAFLTILLTFNLKSQDLSCIDSIYQNSSRNEAYQGNFEDKIFIIKSNWKKGYIIMNEGDTLIGEIKIHTDGIHIYFRNETLKKKLRADKYKVFKYDKHFFASKKFDNYPFNVEIIELGPISLYAYEQHSNYPGMAGGTMRVDLVQFYVEKGSAVYGPFNLNYKDILLDKSWINECFSDCPYLLSKIPQKNLKFPELLKACQSYNCWYYNNLGTN